MLSSVDEVIKALGGNAAVASLARVGRPSVSNWIKRGRISHGSSMIIREALADLGMEATPSVFGFKEVADQEART